MDFLGSTTLITPISTPESTTPSPSTATDSDSSGSPTSGRGRNSTREASRVLARRRRGSEAQLLRELAQALVPGRESRALDKMSTLRLAVGRLKLKRLTGHCHSTGATPGGASATLTTKIEQAFGGGLMLVFSRPHGEVVYVSSTVRESLGYSQLEVMSRSVFELCHPEDQDQIQYGLLAATAGRCSSALIRLRHSGRAVGGDRYRVFHVRGRLRQAYDDDEVEGGGLFIGVADPIPHPADARFPLWWWLSENTFTSVLTLDMRFVSADASFAKVLGYSEAEIVGRKCFEFVYAEDATEDVCKCSELLTKGQVQVDRVRLLSRGGGYVVVLAQKTTLNSNAVITSRRRNRAIVVSRHYILGVEEAGKVFSAVQMGTGGGEKEPPAPMLSPTPPQTPMTPSIPEDLLFAEDYTA